MWPGGVQTSGPPAPLGSAGSQRVPISGWVGTGLPRAGQMVGDRGSPGLAAVLVSGRVELWSGQTSGDREACVRGQAAEAPRRSLAE